MYRRLMAAKPIISGALCLFLMFSQSVVQAEEVNVYSARKEALILPLLEKFAAETGIGFNLITAKADALLKRLESEGRSTPRMSSLLLMPDGCNAPEKRVFCNPLLIQP